ncbi:MAG: tetratricopeptide repeat protein [Deltaproteobacteria bacterium]|jgi:tetratricopeptide (TPR) repeat protein|nr:tetratricopeptide repeat protein [Deltaproteobacteria bacterium]
MAKKAGQPTILLVDSDLELLDKNGALLQEMGLFNHLHAENGSEALAMIRNFNPDLLILSQNLPDISGLTILSKVRQFEEGRSKTIIIIYGDKINERVMAKAGRIGVDDVIIAPYDDDTFKRQIFNTLYEEPDPRMEEAEKLNEKCSELIGVGKLDEALATCNDIIKLSDNAEVYYNMGYILSVRGDFEGALRSFKKATLINDQHARAFKQMGLIYQKMGKIDDAQRNLEHAAELHLVLNQENEAEEILNTVLTLRPNTTNVYNTLGIIYRHQGRLQESVGAYEKARKIHPDDENIFFNMARVYIDLNDIPQAQEALRKAVSLNRKFTPAADLLRATELGIKLRT